MARLSKQQITDRLGRRQSRQVVYVTDMDTARKVSSFFGVPYYYDPARKAYMFTYDRGDEMDRVLNGGPEILEDFVLETGVNIDHFEEA